MRHHREVYTSRRWTIVCAIRCVVARGFVQPVRGGGICRQASRGSKTMTLSFW
jgi:hypothetical protein